MHILYFFLIIIQINTLCSEFNHLNITFAPKEMNGIRNDTKKILNDATRVALIAAEEYSRMLENKKKAHLFDVIESMKFENEPRDFTILYSDPVEMPYRFFGKDVFKTDFYRNHVLIIKVPLYTIEEKEKKDLERKNLQNLSKSFTPYRMDVLAMRSCNKLDVYKDYYIFKKIPTDPFAIFTKEKIKKIFTILNNPNWDDLIDAAIESANNQMNDSLIDTDEIFVNDDYVDENLLPKCIKNLPEFFGITHYKDIFIEIVSKHLLENSKAQKSFILVRKNRDHFIISWDRKEQIFSINQTKKTQWKNFEKMKKSKHLKLEIDT